MGESTKPTWQERVDAVWDDPEVSAEETVTRIAELVSELPADDPRGPFELGGAYDSAGNEALAAEQYALAVELGLSGSARARLDIQHASTLRNLGRAGEAVAMLRASPRDPALGASPDAFLALALHSAGDSTEALAVALDALIPFLPRYERSLRGYVAELRHTPSP